MPKTKKSCSHTRGSTPIESRLLSPTLQKALDLLGRTSGEGRAAQPCPPTIKRTLSSPPDGVNGQPPCEKNRHQHDH